MTTIVPVYEAVVLSCVGPVTGVRCVERPRRLTLLVSLIDPYLGGRLSGGEHAKDIGLVCKGERVREGR
jgi:hypothetical protein